MPYLYNYQTVTHSIHLTMRTVSILHVCSECGSMDTILNSFYFLNLTPAHIFCIMPNMLGCYSMFFLLEHLLPCLSCVLTTVSAYVNLMRDQA